MQDSSIGDVPLVILAVTLSAAGIVVSLSCSWMTSKKRRVANNSISRGDSLMLQMSEKDSSPNMKAPPSKRYSTPTPVVILPISSLAHTLVAPTIIITPPSPLGILADSNSVRSDSSIGSAADLLIEDDGTIGNGEGTDDKETENVDFCGDSLDEENFKRERRRFIEVKNKRHLGGQVLYQAHHSDTGQVLGNQEKHNKREKITTDGTSKSTDPQTFRMPQSGSSPNSGIRPQSQTFTINVVTQACGGLGNNYSKGQGNHTPEVARVGEVKDTTTCIELDSVQEAPRPRLRSMEPGTKRSDFHFRRANQISEVQVGNT